MAIADQDPKTGAEGVGWNLADLFAGPADPPAANPTADPDPMTQGGETGARACEATSLRHG